MCIKVPSKRIVDRIKQKRREFIEKKNPGREHQPLNYTSYICERFREHKNIQQEKRGSLFDYLTNIFLIHRKSPISLNTS
jgi:hypothetical protein